MEFENNLYVGPWMSGTPLAPIFLSIQLSYGVPSFGLMLFFLIYLKKYPNSFYRLVQMDLFVNILCYVNTYISLRIPRYFPEDSIVIKLEKLLPGMMSISAELQYFFMNMQFCSTISLSIHRVSSIFFYNTHNQFWSKWYPALGVLYTGYSFIPTMIFGVPDHVYVDNGTLMTITDYLIYEKRSFVTAWSATLYFLLLLVVGVSAAILVSNSIQVPAMNQSDRGIGKKLTRIALSYCAVYTGILSYSVVVGLNAYLDILPVGMFSYVYDTLLFCSDSMTLVLPYILLIFDNNVRRDLSQLFKKKPTVTQVFASTTEIRS